MSTRNLIRCLKTINNFRKTDQITSKKFFFVGCDLQISTAIIEEFLKRFYQPFFIPILCLIACMQLINNKFNNN